MKNLMKTAAGVAILGLSSVALAGGGGMAPPVDDTGWYIGGALGFGLSHWDNLVNGDPGNTTFVRVGKEDDFVARAVVGYNFNRHYSAEFGYTYLPSSVNMPDASAAAGHNVGKVRNWALDLSGKLSAPVMDQVGVFGRLGINYLRTTLTSRLGQPGASPLVGGATRIRNWNVTYGAGVYYDYSPQLRFNAEWQRFHGKSKVYNTKYQPFMDAFTLGVSYRLPDGLLV